MPFQRTPGVCLKTTDWSETSQVLRFFTPTVGKIGCVAKGAKRKKGSFQAPFVILAEYDLMRIEKKPGTLDILTQAERTRSYREIPRDYSRYVAACFAAEFVDQFAPEGQKIDGLYELLIEVLDRLDTGTAVPDAIFSFEVRALKVLGYVPRVRECGVCEKAISQPAALFSARDGGAACSTCRTSDERWFPVRRAALESIARFGEGDMPKEEMKRALVIEIFQILDACTRLQLEKDLKGARFLLDQLSAPNPKSESRNPK